ncbi:chromate transporter [Bacillus massiliigorillae]|uniref:chromate transporter n=1 Tax=Bacillus massiliigorillae TaxID=1243664 RepID=UPI0005AA2E6A|nr:chromate transporter [Bacillus massiliigorillae]
MILLDLFITFVYIGLVSFGGGYAIIPVIQQEVLKHKWMTAQQFTDMIAISGMSPGPIATNSAILVGYNTEGLLGATIAVIGMILPSLFLVVLVATFFMKFHHKPIVKSIFYGLRPIVASLVIYAALSFAHTNHLLNLTFSWYTLSLWIIFGLSFIALIKFRWSPLYVILLSGLVGVVLYS